MSIILVTVILLVFSTTVIPVPATTDLNCRLSPIFSLKTRAPAPMLSAVTALVRSKNAKFALTFSKAVRRSSPVLELAYVPKLTV